MEPWGLCKYLDRRSRVIGAAAAEMCWIHRMRAVQERVSLRCSERIWCTVDKRAGVWLNLLLFSRRQKGKREKYLIEVGSPPLACGPFEV